MMGYGDFQGISQTYLQPDDMKYDVAVLKATWESTHGGLYRYNTREEIETYFSVLNSRISKPLSLRDFFILISQLNARIHCGHTFVSFYNNKNIIKDELYSKYFLPVMFRVIDDSFVITHNLSENADLQQGQKILAINGIPVKTICDSLLTVSKADGKNGHNKQLDNISIYKRDISTKHYCLFDIYFPLFFKKYINDEHYVLTVLSGKDTLQMTIKGLQKEEREKRFISQYGQVPKNEESWYIKEINEKTVLFRLGDFATYNWKFNFTAYLDSVFTVIQKKKYSHLIIDIRENEGGADAARDAVLSYLTPITIGCANPVRRLYRYTSIPDSLKQYLNTWDDEFKKDKTGYFLTSDGYYEHTSPSLNCDTIYSRPNHFKGKLFLITDATNSSATFIMADCIKRNKLGYLVGEKTGGSQQGINGGELFFFYMPKSKIEMDVPLIWQRPFHDMPDEGIEPDYIVQTTCDDIEKKRDPQMNFILKTLLSE